MGGEHAELIVPGIKKLLQFHGIAAGELHSKETVRENHMILLEPCAHFAKSRCRKVTCPRSTFVMTCKSVIYNVV